MNKKMSKFAGNMDAGMLKTAKKKGTKKKKVKKA